jgi:hypothetical protein
MLGARARYDLARLAEGDARFGEARAELEGLLRDAPNAPIAPSALERLLRLTERDAGIDAALALSRRLLAALGDSELGERLGYAEARFLHRLEAFDPARKAYLELARRHPYPDGVLWDDALFHAAVLERRLGRPRAAYRHLECLLAARETAAFVGSYERRRYDDARFLLAEIVRDDLADPARARESFVALWNEHPTSRLRDDALWQAALIDFSAGRAAAGCELLARLSSAQPDSRYAACAPLVCPHHDAPPASCHRYVARQLRP